MAESAKWYVIHTYSGYENTVAATISKAVENRGMQDLIQEVVMARNAGCTVDRLADSIHGHPTLTEVVMTAARQF